MKNIALLAVFLLIICHTNFAQRRVQKNIDKGNYASVIKEYKTRLEKLKKKGNGGEYDQFLILVYLASVEYQENPKNPDISEHYRKALELERKVNEAGYTGPEYWEAVWQLADVATALNKYDDSYTLVSTLITGAYDNNFLKNNDDSLALFSGYGFINSLFGENESTYNLITELPDKPGMLRLVMVEALERDQRMVQAEEILLHDLLKLKEKPAANPELYFSYLNALTSLYIDLELFSKAQTYLVEAGIYARQHASVKPELLTSVYRLSGDYYRGIGNKEKAAHYYSRAAQNTKTTDESYLDLLISSAEVADTPAQADSLLRRAEEVSRSSNPTDSLALAMNLYSISIALENRTEELRLYREALQILIKLFPKRNCHYLSRIYTGIGIAYERLEKFDSARVNFQKSKALSEAMGIQCNKCYGLSLVGLGDAALNEDNSALASFSYDDAIRFYKKIFGDMHSYTRLASSRMIDYHWFYKSSEADKQFEMSFTQTASIIKSYFPALTEQDREKFYENLKIDYDKYPSYVMDLRNRKPLLIGSLYNHQLQTKAFLLNNFNRWKNQILNSGDIKLIRELDKWQTNKELLTKVSHLEQADVKKMHLNIDSLTTETDVLERKLYEQAQGYSTEMDQPATWEEIRAKLKEKEAAIEIVRFNRYNLRQHILSDSVIYCALIITASSKVPTLVVLDRGNSLEGKYLKGYLNKTYYHIEDGSSYDVFWKAINEQLKGVNKIYFSPDGAYHQININTLQNPATGKYLSEEYEIVQVINTKEVLLNKREETFNKTCLLFGSPDFFSGDTKAAEKFRSGESSTSVKDSAGRGITLQDLPGSKEEVEVAAEIMKQKGWNVHLYTGKDATEENLKSNYKPRVLHIATHGYFNLGKYSDQAIMKSGLIFSGGGKTLNSYLDYNVYKPEGEDGILTPFEAMNLNLENTDLVILSACQSGVGEVKPGEGIYGLQRAFKMAGARSLIISLWPVDDAATKEFITQFYSNQFVAGLSKTEAFKKAQMYLKQKYKAPYYWGAFIMVGI